MGSKRTVLALVVFVTLAAMSAATSPDALSVATTYTVDSAADWGDGNLRDGVCRTSAAHGSVCTFRAAIEQANVNDGRDTINFAIPGAGVHHLRPATRYPDIDQAVIDGYSQPGARPNTLAAGDDAIILIEIDGRDVPRPDGRTFFYTPYTTAGLLLGRGPSLVRGLAVHSFVGGIVVTGFEHVVAGNYVGLSADGTEAPGNTFVGIHIVEGGHHRIGGGDRGDRNVVAENAGNGIRISGFGGHSFDYPIDNTVTGNYIGTDPTGLLDRGNGIGLYVGGSDNVVDGNVISGNEGAGVEVPYGRHLRLVDNLIGTDVTGAAALGNGGLGVDARIGELEISGNTIAANGEHGLKLGFSAGTVVTGNRIGTSADGSSSIGNGGSGIWVEAGSVRIGGPEERDGNVISGNAEHGVLVTGSYLDRRSDAHRIEGNRIGTTASGERRLGNTGDGIAIDRGVDGTAVVGNLVSANGGRGIQIDGRTDRTAVGGNYVGTDAEGTRAFPNGSDGVHIGCDCPGAHTSHAVVDGNLISGNTGFGVALETSVNSVRNNRIGTDRKGLDPLGNGRSGVFVSADGNLIGANVVSANHGFGIELAGEHGNRVARNTAIGNMIGTDLPGVAGLGNAAGGVSIVNGRLNTIGGFSPKQWNVISDSGSNPRNRLGEQQPGVAISGRSEENEVRGNFIGTDATGTVALGNRGDGVSIACGEKDCPRRDTIGGTTAGSANVIFANALNGVAVYAGVTRTVIQGNRIGADRSGQGRLANFEAGVLVSDAADVAVGGEDEGAGNIVFGNSVGVLVLGDDGRNARILSNFIEANRGLGIDLGGDAVTANDDRDPDGGPNGLQNYPVLTNALSGPAGTTVFGVLNSVPHRRFLLEFFVSSTCDPSGYGEGQRLLGRALSRETDDDGNVDIKVTFEEIVPIGRTITATATLDGTSEFSACITVNAADPIP